MADLITASETIKRLAVQFQGIIDVADALGQLGSLQNATSEMGAARESALADLAKAKGELAKAKSDLGKAKSDADLIIGAANDQAAVVLGGADQKAQSILDQAALQANKFIADGAAQAKVTIDAAASQVAELSQAKAALKNDVLDLGDVIAAKQSALDEIETKLTAAKESIAKLLG